MQRLPLILAALAVAGGLAWQATREESREASRPEPGPSEGAPSALRSPAPSRSAALLAHEDAADFPALPEPGPSDWLANHEEEGQSLREFRARARREVTAERRTLRLQPLDDVSTMGVDVAALAGHLRIYYGLPVQTSLPARPPDLLTRTNPHTHNRQILTRDVLRWLEGEITSDLVCVLAITTEDLYPEDTWNFVFGQASLLRGVGVFSFARMDPAFPAPPADPTTRTIAQRTLVLRRCLKVVTHEVGHMFGLEHCIERSCLMNGSNHAAEMDRTPLHLCFACLRKVHYATRLDVEKRYQALRAFYRREGLEAEASWVEALLARVPR